MPENAPKLISEIPPRPSEELENPGFTAREIETIKKEYARLAAEKTMPHSASEIEHRDAVVSSGEIRRVNPEGLDNTLLLVGTEKGVIVEREAVQRMGTEEVNGCAVACAVGPTEKLIVHLTPSGSRGLGYKREDKSAYDPAPESAKRIADAIGSKETFKGYRMILINTLGNTHPEQRFSEERQRADLTHLKALLVQEGFTEEQIVVADNIPVDYAGVFHDENAPHQILVVGMEASQNDEGRLVVSTTRATHRRISF